MSYGACKNTVRYLVATSTITSASYTGTTEEIFNTRIAGQDYISKVSTVKAPLTPGTYQMKVEINGYKPPSFKTTLNGTTVATGSSFDDLKVNLLYYIQYSAFSSRYTAASLSFPSFNDLAGLNSYFEYNLGMSGIVSSEVPGGLDFNRAYNINMGVNGVDAIVKASPTGTGLKAVTINKGTNAYVEWRSQVASQCTCTCLDTNDNPIICGNNCYNEDGSQKTNCTNTSTSSCGTGIGTPKQSTPWPITGITQTTKFKVSCN